MRVLLKLQVHSHRILSKLERPDVAGVGLEVGVAQVLLLEYQVCFGSHEQLIPVRVLFRHAVVRHLGAVPWCSRLCG